MTDADGTPVCQAGLDLPGYFRYDRETIRNTLFADPSTLEAKLRAHERYRTNPRTIVDHIGDCLALCGGEALLDLGCGNGVLLLLQLARRLAGTGTVTGLDIAPGVLAAAARNAAAAGVRIDWVDGSADDLSAFTDRSFDRITASYMFHYVDDPARACQEMLRVSRPGGRTVISTDSAQTMPEMYQLHFEALARLGAPAEVRRGTPKHRFSLENGADVLGPHFARIERRDYSDVLVFPDIDSFLDFYVRGYRYCSARAVERMPPDFYAALENEMRAAAQAVIRRRGHFPVTKSTGSFVCW
jgi:ubiquinone/menaquinone biosynthesis C-methylase UbiE